MNSSFILFTLLCIWLCVHSETATKLSNYLLHTAQHNTPTARSHLVFSILCSTIIFVVALTRVCFTSSNVSQCFNVSWLRDHSYVDHLVCREWSAVVYDHLSCSHAAIPGRLSCINRLQLKRLFSVIATEYCSLCTLKSLFVPDLESHLG